MAAQEHFIFHLNKTKNVLVLFDTFLPKMKLSRRIVFYLMEVESHEIGLLLANYIAKELGGEPFILGSNYP